MGRAVVFTQPKTVGFEDYPDLPLAPAEVRLRTLYTGISAGTELTAYRGSNPYIHKFWEKDRRLFVAAETTTQPYPMRGWGYEEVGEVVELGPAAAGVRLGDLVYGAWGHRTTHIVSDEYARQRRLPDGLPPRLGIFSHIGSIALNGVHDAALRIGETVAVFGLGVPGQIVAQLARRSGVRVIAVDLFEERLDLARRLGAVDVALNPRDGSAAERIKTLTGGRGADVSIEVSGAAAALAEAIRATAYSSKVIAMGFIQNEARGLYLGEEFHHNRVNVVSSQISGVSPDLDHRWDRLRLAQTAMQLQAEGVLNLGPLITHTFPLYQAAEAFRLLDEDPVTTLQVVLDCQGT
jgi:threonine dehydrogenase-like Zn-dependent dehydrogenase